MLRLCRIDIGRSEEVLERVKRYKDRVVKELKPTSVILFGSFARGDINEGSDVDIMVIADFEEAFLDRIGLLLGLNDDVKLPLEPIGYTPEEFARMREERNSFIIEALKGCKVLYGTIVHGGSKPMETDHG